MNLRISDGRLRFRITRAELEQLLQGTAVQLSLPLAPTYHYSVEISDSWDLLALKEDSNNWTLLVDSQALKELAAQLPSREGLRNEVEVAGKLLTIMLEVDVRRTSTS